MITKIKNVRLPEGVTPKEYFITIKPDLLNFTFEGEEEIILDLKQSTNMIQIHADELEIPKVTYNGNIQGYVTFDKKTETATIKFQQELPQGEGKLFIKFTGILNDKMRGFYRSKYSIDGIDHTMAVTQFESTDARRAFPSFDEPAKKAIFNIKLIVPKDHTAISNTIESEIKEHSAGYNIISFEPTPKMSTYLLAFIIGKFEHIEKKTREGTLVRIFVTPGKKTQAEFALDVAVKTISFFSDYFKIPYPLPVIDLIAIPDFASGAMENWGAVTYRETALLVDPEHTATINKQWVALVIAHEFTHQWFGNLVTMEWWTHLWLNEGFASYIEYLAVDHIFPEWNIWTQFVYMDHSRALELDGLANTHPIEVEVHHPSEISEIFDAVSYSKGASIIRMLAEYLGENIFRKGLTLYLNKHSYGNAQTSDLWKALEKVSGKPVQNMMNNWTQKAGYPLLTVMDKKDKLVISQSRFFSSPISSSDSTDKTLWIVPVSIISQSFKETQYHLLQKKTIYIEPQTGDGWIKLNAGEKSLVRVHYPKSYLFKLKSAIEEKGIGEEDRFGIIRDLFVLSEAGKASVDQALELYRAYLHEDSYVVWAEIATELARLSNLLAEESYHNLFEEYACDIFIPLGEKLGWEKKQNESHANTLLRSVTLASLGKYGHNETILKARKLFKKMLNDNISIDSDLRGIVYGIVAKHGDKKTYDDLMRLYRKANLQEEKDRIFKALCAFSQKDLLTNSLEFAFSSEVRTQDSFKSIYFIWGNPNGRYLAWNFLKSHWEEIVARFSGGHLFSRFVEPAEFFTKKEMALEVEEFFKEHGAPGAERTVSQVTERIISNDAWLERDSEKIKYFLSNYKKAASGK